MKGINNKIIAMFLVLAFVFSPLFTNKARAQWITWDPTNFVPNWGVFIKEMSDALAWMAVNLVIERVTAQTINWINTGFQGGPAFVTDPGRFFFETGDRVAGQYIFTNPNLNFLCGPINARIRLALAQNFLQERMWMCTVTQVVRNYDAFMNNFEHGGWDGFFELSQRQQNSPLGAFMQAQNELDLMIMSQRGIRAKELDWGSGISPFKTCERGPPKVVGTGGVPNADGTINTQTIPGDCIPGTERTETPGVAIQGQLDMALGSGSRRLDTADEINEIVSALLNQLTLRAVGGVGGGLRSLSRPGSGAGTIQTFVDQINAGTTTDYFGGTQNTEMLDIRPNLEQPIQGRTPVFPPNQQTPPTDPNQQSGGNYNCDPNIDPNCPQNP